MEAPNHGNFPESFTYPILEHNLEPSRGFESGYKTSDLGLISESRNNGIKHTCVS